MKFAIVLTIGCLFFAAWGYSYETPKDNMRVFAQWGIASTHPGTQDTSKVKFAEFGVAGNEKRLAYTVGAGGWHDATGYSNGSGIKIDSSGELKTSVRDSLFFETLFGVEPQSDNFYMGYKLGPAIITNTDCLLGSNIQIGHEFGFGMKDITGVRVGLILKHYSNAGIVKPNAGRDLIGMRIEF